MTKSALSLAVGAVAILAVGLVWWSFGSAGVGTAPTTVSDRDNVQEVAGMVPREFAIEGMMCQGCVDTVTSALAKVPGVQSATVSLERKRAVVLAEESKVPAEAIVAAIVAAGYKGELAQPARSR